MVDLNSRRALVCRCPDPACTGYRAVVSVGGGHVTRAQAGRLWAGAPLPPPPLPPAPRRGPIALVVGLAAAIGHAFLAGGPRT